MSIIMRTYESDTPREILAYAYTRADEYNETVVIYRRIIQTDNLNTAIMYEYISTGIDSDIPEDAVIWTSIGPRTPIYDRPIKPEMCC